MKAIALLALLWAMPAWADRPWFPGGMNYLPDSENIGGASCVFIAYPIELNVSAPLAPSGTPTADSWNYTNALGFQASGCAVASGLTAGATYTASLWARADSGAPSLTLYSSSCISFADVVGTGVTLSSTEWRRVSLSYNTGAGTCMNVFFRGPGLPQTVAKYYFWGFQVNAGLRPLPYHPTAGAATTWSPRFKKVGMKWSPF